MKHIYLFLVAFCLCVSQTLSARDAMPTLLSMEETPAAELPDEREGAEAELNAIALSFSGSQVHITNAAGETLEIFNLTGVRVATFRIDSDDKTVTLNLPRGCYMLKVGKIVRKISIR